MTLEPDADWSLIPEHMREAVTAYVDNRRPVGHFLTAVLSNDLREAVARADATNITRLADYVRFLYNYAPARCWGSPERVKAWLAGEEDGR